MNRRLALAAASLAITVGADPTAGVPTQIGTTGAVSGPGIHHAVSVRYKPAGATPCATTGSDDDGSIAAADLLADGPFSRQDTVTFDRSGDYLLCAWLTRGWLGAPEEVLATRSRIVRVRAPRLGLAIAATPSSILSGQAVQVGFTAQAEVQRALFLYAVPDVGRGCPANAEAADETDGASAVITGRSILGGPQSATADVTLERDGTRLLCAYLQREDASDPAEAVAQASVTVLAPPPPCVVPSVVAGEPLTGVVARVQGASCVVGVVHFTPSARYARGSVFKAAPAAGTSLAHGAPVELWVSAGPPCVVPGVPASRTLAAVRSRIAHAGCRAGRVLHRRSAHIRRGRVIGLCRPRGTRLPPRTRVAIVVSRGRGRD